MTGFQKVSWLLHGKVRIQTQVGLTQTFNIYMLDILHTLAEFFSYQPCELGGITAIYTHGKKGSEYLITC